MSRDTIRHDSNALIDPGQDCTLIIRPQRTPLRLIALDVHVSTFTRFDLVGCNVGNRSQFVGPGLAVNLLPFTRRWPLRLLAEEPLLCFETIQCAMDFWITVRNVGDRASRFIADWPCEAPEVEPIGPTVSAKRMGDGAPIANPEIAIIRRPQSVAYRPERIHIAPTTLPNPLERLRRESGHSAAAWAPDVTGRPRTETKTPPGFGWDLDDPSED